MVGICLKKSNDIKPCLIQLYCSHSRFNLTLMVANYADDDITDADDLGKNHTCKKLNKNVVTELLNLSDDEKKKLCSGDHYLSNDCDITFNIFECLYEIAEAFSANHNNAIKLMIPCLNQTFLKHDFKTQNVARKYRKVKEK